MPGECFPSLCHRRPARGRLYVHLMRNHLLAIWRNAAAPHKPSKTGERRRRQGSLSVDGPQLYLLISVHRQNQQCPVTCRFCASHLRHLCTPFRALASDALANSVLCPSYRCSTLSSGRQIFARAGGGFRSRWDVTVSSTGRFKILNAI